MHSIFRDRDFWSAVAVVGRKNPIYLPNFDKQMGFRLGGSGKIDAEPEMSPT